MEPMGSLGFGVVSGLLKLIRVGGLAAYDLRSCWSGFRVSGL